MRWSSYSFWLKVNETIIERINEKYKNINWDILSEENVKVSSENVESNNDWMWVLDPLDGTNFIQKTGNCTVHLALNFKKSHILVLFCFQIKINYGLQMGKKHGVREEMDQNMNKFSLKIKNFKRWRW